MTTGLATFDQFSWSSLLKGRVTLLVDRNRQRALSLAQALEEAGATVTLAPSQAVARDRWRDTSFSLLILVLGTDETISDSLRPCLTAPGIQSIVLCDRASREKLRAAFPSITIGDVGMSDRDLVMFITGTPDE